MSTLDYTNRPKVTVYPQAKNRCDIIETGLINRNWTGLFLYNMNFPLKNWVNILLTIVLSFGFPAYASAGTMSSPSFVITTDDISVGGGMSSSASYAVQDDVGGAATGENIDSVSFRACAGYPCALNTEPPSITFTITPNSIALGALTVGSVSSGSVMATTTTNSTNGYATTIAADGGLRSANGDVISGVSDGSVTAGSDEYGVGLIGTERSFIDQRSILITPRTIAESAGPITDSSVTVTFKAAISATVPAGSYSQIATFVSTARF